MRSSALRTDAPESEIEIRDKIAALIDAIARVPQLDLPVKHIFAPGVYCRELFIPAGSVIVGKIHRHAHFNFISFGHVRVYTKDGLQELRGPCSMVSSSGTQRALYAIADTLWTTIHANPTGERDLLKLETAIIAPNYAALAASDSDDTLEFIK